VASPNPLGGTIMTGYIYDAEGTRVSKGTIQAWSCNPTISQYATTSDYIIGLGEQQFSEYTMNASGTMAWQHTNVWAGSLLIATYAQDDTVKSGTTTENGLLHFYFDDPLGTRRAQTDYAGHLEQTCSSLPYGDSESCGSSPTEHLFTGKERDAESGNDYFGARYYASSMGRFMSPDWSAKAEPVPYSKLDDPQSLNLYAYVRNNPLTTADADGHSGTSGGLAMEAQNASPMDPSLWDKKQPPTASAPNVAPGTADTRTAVLGILNSDNTCSEFFNAGAATLPGANGATAAQIFSAVDINVTKDLPVTTAAVTQEGKGADGAIFVNLNGAFFNTSAVVKGTAQTLTVAPGYPGGFGSTRKLIILHELGHLLNLLPKDGNNASLSNANSQKIVDNCKKELNQ
jgi:RHS repeat-associated protein